MKLTAEQIVAIVAAFDSVEDFAREVSVAATTVYGWRHKGCPRWQTRHIRDACERRRIDPLAPRKPTPPQPASEAA